MKTLYLKIDDDIHAALTVAAKLTKQPISRVANVALREALAALDLVDEIAPDQVRAALKKMQSAVQKTDEGEGDGQPDTDPSQR